MKLHQQNNISVFQTSAALAQAAADLMIKISKQAIEVVEVCFVLIGRHYPLNVCILF